MNGTSWTEITNVNTARTFGASAGVSTDGLIYSGDNSPGIITNTETWNGSAWTEVNDVNTGRYFGAAGGVSTLAMFSRWI
jgi:hypothetical protein